MHPAPQRTRSQLRSIQKHCRRDIGEPPANWSGLKHEVASKFPNLSKFPKLKRNYTRRNSHCLYTEASGLLSSSRKSRPLVSRPKIQISTSANAAGNATSPAATPSAGTNASVLKPCAIKPPILLQPATH